MNKILFNKKTIMDHNNTENRHYSDIYGKISEMYLVPFTYDSQGHDYLHEPNYNLTSKEVEFKFNLMKRIEKALDSRGMKLLNISFSSNKIVIAKL